MLRQWLTITKTRSKTTDDTIEETTISPTDAPSGTDKSSRGRGRARAGKIGEIESKQNEKDPGNLVLGVRVGVQKGQ